MTWPKDWFSFLFLLLGASSVFAEVRLPSVLADHMVLQRNSTVRLWGWSGPSENLQITPSWDSHTYDIKADRNARWEVTIPTPEAGGPFEIVFKASNTITISDVLVGEVWVCSGQSNMEWSAEHGYDRAEEEVAAANHPSIRLFKIPKTTAQYPQDDCVGTWKVCSPASIRDFSAVAYFFGRHLQHELEDIPIGLIQAAWGGTAAEVWTPEHLIESDPDFKHWDEVLYKADGWPRRPASAYNGMIHPIIPFKVSGVIWYQGESNTQNPIVYRRLLPTMIQSWRDAWDFPLPFYFVQIAPYRYDSSLSGALVRESQLQTMRKVPNTGMVVISDVGNIYDIHPRNKQDVGKRLADWALARTYGREGIAFSGPLYREHKVEEDGVRIYFDYAEEGLLADGPLTDFEIAGADKIFFPAKARIEGSEVVISAPYVLNPQAVRFGFTNTATPNLFNQHGLPASSFRTDDWPLLVKDVAISIAYKKDAEAYLVTLTADEDVSEILYTTNGDPPGLFGLTYRQPFYIDGECTVRAQAFTDGRASDSQMERKIMLDKATFKPIKYDQPFDQSRSAGGDMALIDGINGGKTFDDGKWQGFYGNDLRVVLDFGRRIEISGIKLTALKHQDAGIFLPNKVLFEVSNDGKRFIEIYRKPLFHAKDDKVEIAPYDFRFNKPRKSQYVRISAENVGEHPAWHPNAGEKAWLMVDEIAIE